MTSLASLWMPICVSAGGVFVASATIWMALPIHKNDYKKLPDEDALQAAVRAQKISPAMYMFPSCTHKELRENPAIQAKMKAGPVGVLTVLHSRPKMGLSMGMWLVFNVLVATAVAALAGQAFSPGSPAMEVFAFAGLAALLAHASGAMPDSIWRGKPWNTLPAALFDAVVYAILTGGAFALLWPVH